jgi:hypothetical protein
MQNKKTQQFARERNPVNNNVIDLHFKAKRYGNMVI